MPPHDSAGSPTPVPTGPTAFLSGESANAQASPEALNEAVRTLVRERDYLREIRNIQLAEFESELTEHRTLVKELRRLYGTERRAFREKTENAERELATQAQRVGDLERKRDEWRERARELEGTLADHRARLFALQQEFDTYRAQTAGLQPELVEQRARVMSLLGELADHRDQAAVLLVERDAMLQERESLLQDREELRAGRDTLLQERKAVREAQDALTADRDAWRERASLAEARAAMSLFARWKRKLGRFFSRS